MREIYFGATVFCFVVAFCGSSAVNFWPEELLSDVGIRTRRQTTDECRPPPAPHHHHHHHKPHHHAHHSEENDPKVPPICCELPNVMPAIPEAWGQCRDILFGVSGLHSRQSHKGQKNVHADRSSSEESGKAQLKRSNDNSGEESEESIPSSPNYFQEKKECFVHCVFNVSGLLTADELLNEEILSQKLIEEVANNTRWSTQVDPVFKKCIAAAKEANSQSQKICKLGTAEYLKCMSRELFFNCPNDIWVNSAECNELKDHLEKCPNLSPPQRPRHHHHHHHHHHHNHHHRKNQDQNPQST